MNGSERQSERKRDDKLTRELIRFIKRHRRTTVTRMVREKKKDAYEEVNRYRGQLASRVRKLVRQGRLVKEKTDSGTYLRLTE